MKYTFLHKALFFPEKGILVVGDLHIGYEAMLQQSGVLIPARQIKDIIEDLKKIFKEIKKRGHELKKVVFIGDLKHAFYFELQEKNEFQEVMEFLGDILPEENIILIKGNHDTMDYTFEGRFRDFYIDGDTAFVHGHKQAKEIMAKSIKTIVMGHLHPSIILAEKPGVKREAFKCFLDGTYQGKNYIIVPSFLDFAEGTPVNDYKEDYIESFSIVPRKAILDFKVYVIGKDQVYDFGKVREME